MASEKYPFKLALAALFLDGAERAASGAAAELADEYAGRRFFNPVFVAACLQSLAAVGILERRTALPEAREAAVTAETRLDAGQAAGAAGQKRGQATEAARDAGQPAKKQREAGPPEAGAAREIVEPRYALTPYGRTRVLKNM